MQHIARSKITDFISYIEIYSAFFSFFNNKWGNFAVIQRVVSIYNGDPQWVYRVYNYMILRNLSILNFKNIGEASLEFSPKLNCFLGSNGEGKTNLLDAIYYLSFCRSAFNPIDSQIIKHDADFLMLDAAYATDEEEPVAVYCGMKRGQKKQLKRDKKAYKRLSQHIGLIPLIFVSPADQTLIAVVRSVAD